MHELIATSTDEVFISIDINLTGRPSLL